MFGAAVGRARWTRASASRHDTPSSLTTWAAASVAERDLPIWQDKDSATADKRLGDEGVARVKVFGNRRVRQIVERHAQVGEVFVDARRGFGGVDDVGDFVARQPGFGARVDERTGVRA